MKDAIIVFERPDIDAALALQSQHQDAEVWVFDPHLMDNLIERGLRKGRYIDVPLNMDLSGFVDTVRGLAMDAETAIEAHLTPIIPEVRQSYWQYSNLYHIFAAIIQYAKLWDAFLKSAPDVHLHIPLRDVPATYYAHSFLPSVLLLERLHARGHGFSAYAHSNVAEFPQFIAAPRNELADEAFEVFLHIPTCIYDREYYCDELQLTGQKSLNFAAQNWNVPIAAFKTVDLTHVGEAQGFLPDQARCHLQTITDTIASQLSERFRSFLRTDGYALRQSQHVANQYHAQATFFLLLEQAFGTKPPRKIVLSNHDAGMHGPFMSFAQRHGIPVVMLPHAKIFNWPIASHYRNLTVLTHPIQGQPITNLKNDYVKAEYIDFPEHQSRATGEHRHLGTIGIVLNKFSGDGISLVDTKNYIAGLRRLIAWCDQHEVVYRIRCKPGGTCVNWLASELGLAIDTLLSGLTGSLADFAKQCDLAVLYDCPTSGAIDFLRASIPTVNAVIRPLVREEKTIIDDAVIPFDPIENLIDRLRLFKSDPTHLTLFRNSQFAAYTAKFGHATPLHVYL